MSRVAKLLLVDDDPADIDILCDYLDDAPFAVEIETAKDGCDAMDLLRAGSRPDIIVLDLNMPRKNGFETLKEIREDPELAHLKVIILTTSDQDDHIMQSFEQDANYFVTKPSLPGEFDALLQLMDDFLKAFIWKE